MATRSRSRWLTALPVALALSLAAACSGDDSDEGHPGVITDPVETTASTSTSSTSTSSTTTIDPDAAVKAEVEAAYLAYSGAVLEIFAAPNPGNPLIDQHMTGSVREATLDSITDDVLNGRSVRPPEDPNDYRTTVLEVTVSGGGDSAVVKACVVDGGVVIDNATGDVLNDDLATLYIEADLVRQNGWKVSESRVLERREERWNCVD